MSLIDFPNVPIAPGVPDVRRSITGIEAIVGTIGLVENLDQLGIIDAIIGPRWGIYDQDGNITIEPDTVVNFAYRGEEKLATHPTEEGNFSTYNKVAMPYDIKMTIACNGQGQTTRQNLLKRLDDLKSSIDLFEIVTPYASYGNVNMISYDYRQQSNKGVNLLMVEMQFQEVRETARSVSPPTQEPAGGLYSSIGTVKAREPARSEGIVTVELIN